jgi:hypothetical protein
MTSEGLGEMMKATLETHERIFFAGFDGKRGPPSTQADICIPHRLNLVIELF